MSAPVKVSGDGSSSATLALRAFEEALRCEDRDMRADLSLGANDLSAVRLVLDRGADGLRPSDLARELGISSAATTALIDRLERAGFVERSHDAEDRRSVSVRSTLDADSAIVRAIDRASERRLRALESLETGDRAVLARSLNAVTAAISAEETR
ncbi:MarR family transcriptional regulator [uncultured Microbacterium sp.]|jgi:DNA-binding MarR family transcriptional regulator|uniref:MarR family winged helix-turn-helix transcriptional regulator n=1 Tax=uncultured Microbacterium sp. TaxID=191216 RepID=UPI0025EA706A|nr:MarR family transcriptional regulator [uncultured Microbacterium sp.]